MTNFYSLNRSKLVFAFSFISVLAFCITLAVLFVSGMFNQYTLIYNLIVLFESSLFWPLAILFLAYINLRIRQSNRQKSLSHSPFNQLDDLGFKPYQLHLEDKWQFTEIIPSVVWNGYTILLDIEQGFKNSRLKFLALVENNRMDETRFNELQKYFETKNMAFDFGGIARFVTVPSDEIQNTGHLKTILDELISILELEHFIPASSRLL